MSVTWATDKRGQDSLATQRLRLLFLHLEVNQLLVLLKQVIDNKSILPIYKIVAVNTNWKTSRSFFLLPAGTLNKRVLSDMIYSLGFYW